MGLLSQGVPLDWISSLPYHNYIKQHGIIQFLNIYNTYHNRKDDIFLWGDEVEMLLIDFSNHMAYPTQSIDQNDNTLRYDNNGYTDNPGPTSDRGLHNTPNDNGSTPSHTTAHIHTNGTSTNDPVHSTTSTDFMQCRLALRGHIVLQQLENYNNSKPRSSSVCPESANFLPEYGKHMIEATPGTPYGNDTSHIMCVEKNMRYRRKTIESFLLPTERVITLTAFPRMGCNNSTISLQNTNTFTVPTPDTGNITKSVYLADDIISPHPRFGTLSRNIRLRRGEKVDIRIPLYHDINTVKHINNELEQSPPHRSVPHDIDHTRTIHMDAMGFGMGMCCLQVTFQARSVREARHLYDQLAIVAPIMLALTAATPFYRGRVSDIDSRWTVISQAVDCRTPVERGVQTAQQNDIDQSINSNTPPSPHTPCCPAHVVLLPEFELLLPDTNTASSCHTPDVRCSSTPTVQQIVREEKLMSHTDGSCSIPDNKYNIPYSFHRTNRVFKSRYDSVSLYISSCAQFKHEYNDLPLEINNESYMTLIQNNIDELLSRHIAHLFIRDPMAIYSDRLNLNDSDTAEMFENIQSTNWQSVRFKPPPPGVNMGWRVEFRTMEVQLTDYENAAYTVFISLLSRAILKYKINLYVPISKVDDNMCRAHQRASVRQDKYYWRNDIYDDQNVSYSQADMTTIMLGNSTKSNDGLISIVRRYLSDSGMDDTTSKVIEPYLQLISARAQGQLLTTAQWLRCFISNHPLYQHDSIITAELNYDIIEICYGVTKGTIYAPELLGTYCSSDIRLATELIVQDKESVAKMHQRIQQRKTHPHAEFL